METDKPFTQEAVNDIVRERLSKAKAKYEKLVAEKEAEYSRKERLFNAREELSRRGLPDELASLVKLDDDESFSNSLALLEKHFKTEISQGPIVTGKTPENRGRTVPASESGKVDASIRKAMGL